MSATPPAPPLMQFWLRLRQIDFPLGLDEFTALERLVEWQLRAEGSRGDRASLFRLVCLLWAKSRDDEALLKREFDAFIADYLAQPRPETPATPQSQSTTPPAPTATPGTQIVSPAAAPAQATRPALPALLPPPTVDVLAGDPLTLARKAQLRDNTLSANMLRLKTDYFPITIRQMQQSWRHMRRTVREGPRVELDIDATVQKVGRECMLSEPVLVPRRVNRAEVMLLIDCDGSMVPFHLLTRQLSETALRGGGLYSTGIYYFHDYADQYVYLDRVRVKARKMTELLANHDSRCPILIASDAGAARGLRDGDRLAGTRQFLEQLKPSRARLVWLNPMPATRWPGTTAEDVARLIPMFQMNREGLDAAIRVLRGHASGATNAQGAGR